MTRQTILRGWQAISSVRSHPPCRLCSVPIAWTSRVLRRSGVGAAARRFSSILAASPLRPLRERGVDPLFQLKRPTPDRRATRPRRPGHPERWYALFATLAYTDMRWGEASGQMWDDVDFQHRVIYIRRTTDAARSVNPRHFKVHSVPCYAIGW